MPGLPVSEIEIIARLLLSMVLGGVIGFERELWEKPAGFRTHILVALGAALFTVISMYGFFGSGADPARVASNIVVGIGFLGAGTIWRHGTGVQGLTTAASLWTVAAIGMAAGVGFYLVAAAATLAVAAVLFLFKRVEQLFPHRGLTTLRLVVTDTPGQLGRIGTILGQHEVNIENVEFSERMDGHVAVALAVRLPGPDARERVLLDLGSTPGVEEARWQD